MSDQEALKELEDGIIREFKAAIEERLDDDNTYIFEIQPPASIVKAAAVAAAQVLMSFERGYRMDISQEELSAAPVIDHAREREFDSYEPGNVERETYATPDAPAESVTP